MRVLVFAWALVLLSACDGSDANGAGDVAPDVTEARDGVSMSPETAPSDADSGSEQSDTAGHPDVANVDVTEPAGPSLGVLQFQVVHNLADDTCVAAGNCDLRIEAEERIGDWLAELGAVSDMAVLHYDRAIPWLALVEEPPPGADIVAFYDARIDAELAAWLDAFVAAFAASERGYLAVSALTGRRDRLANLRVSPENPESPTTDACPALAPGTLVTMQAGDGSAPVLVDVAVAYGRFVRYLAAKLDPDFVAPLVEANMFWETCPERWPGLVALYHGVYDEVRAAVGPEVPVFATLTLQHLLGYDVESCFAPLPFQACGGPTLSPEWSAPDAERCYPLDLQPLWDLDEGDRLDVLALSFYPDSLLMAPPDASTDRVYVYDAEDPSPTPESCIYRLTPAPFLDPFDQIERFGWSKPVGLAEWSSRSCPSWAWQEDPGGDMLVQSPETSATQAFWLDRGLRFARERGAPFAIYSFLRDYPVLGPWVVRDGVIEASTMSLLNTWPCSGLTTSDGADKPGLTDIWRAARGR